MKKHEFSCLGFICTCTKNDEVILHINRARFEDILTQVEKAGIQNEISHLKAENARYREALLQCIRNAGNHEGAHKACLLVIDTARDALQEF